MCFFFFFWFFNVKNFVGFQLFPSKHSPTMTAHSEFFNFSLLSCAMTCPNCLFVFSKFFVRFFSFFGGENNRKTRWKRFPRGRVPHSHVLKHLHVIFVDDAFPLIQSKKQTKRIIFFPPLPIFCFTINLPDLIICLKLN